MLQCQRQSWGNSPPPLGGHSSTSVVIDGVVYFVLFGGNSDLSQLRLPLCIRPDGKPLGAKNQLLSSVYLFRPDTMEWKELNLGTKGPCPRYCHSACLYDDGKKRYILIYGGFSASRALTDVFLLTLDDDPKKWKWEGPLIHKTDAPAPRYGHCMVLVRDKLIMFGGTNGIAYFNDLYLLEVAGKELYWRPISTAGPSPRAYHSSTYIEWEDHHCLVVFGGRTHNAACSDEIYVLCFNFMENTVFWMQPDSIGTAPCCRYNHSMLAVENKIYVIGGRTISRRGSKRTLGDLHVLNLDTLTWYQPTVAPKSDAIPTRCWHTCNAFQRALYLYGGYSDSATFADLHIVNPNAKGGARREMSTTRVRASFYDITEDPRQARIGYTDSRRKLLGSHESLMALLHGDGKGDSRVNADSDHPAARLMDLLSDFFELVEGYSYKWDEVSHVWSVKTDEFIDTLFLVAEMARKTLADEAILLQLASPCYVLGDIHGNYKDLQFFARSFWNFGMKLCPANVLCLGDYVDRGPHSVEVVAYLFALKVLFPQKLFLLRGNHEFRDVNGDKDMYDTTSFLTQCQVLCGNAQRGSQLWEALNKAFDHMPVAAIIDSKIFCVHGGIPRYTKTNTSNILHDINLVERPLTEKHLLLDQSNQLPFVFDLMWSDPAEEEEEDVLVEQDAMFGVNERGGNTCIFSQKALHEFFRKTGTKYLIRAHQRKDMGCETQKGARVLTVFSSSHYCGGHNSAAAVLVASNTLRVVIVKPNEFQLPLATPAEAVEDLVNVGIINDPEE